MASDATVQAAGGLLWRPTESGRHRGFEVALVHRRRYGGDWSLPKGKATAGETAAVTAWREVTEETGFPCVLGRKLTTVRYTVGSGPKVVEYFAARALEGSFMANKEVDELAWLPLEQAKARCSYEFDAAVLDTFALHPPDLTSIVLVRHAKAGVRDSWSGPDSRRPLDARGRRQAQALRAELRPFGPMAVYCAPLERCRATVAPLAKDLGLPIQREEALTEAAYREHPAAARRLVTYLARQGEPALACSQGGVIPGVVKSLATRADLKISAPSTPKGAYWVLTFEDSLLIQADSYPAPEGG